MVVVIAEQQRDLAQQPAKACRRGVLVTHDGELVLHQRMIDDGDALHGVLRLIHSSIVNGGKKLEKAYAG
jgi:diadenosine tetraphosphatase ApaH/serine/threonine PP2A family protein phosphatase